YNYFEYKIAEKEKKLAEESHRKTTKEEKKSTSAISREEANQKRNRIKALEREQEKLMKELDELNLEKSRIDSEIALPENYSDASKITKLMKEKDEIESRIAEKETRWLEASEEAEKCRE
ncbi:MAG: hypothetical protein IAA97_03655, partial [Spirochaetes bacterium]|nr:hypothetical protein [Candidatus Ornithospirochaeta stercoripullorum]